MIDVTKIFDEVELGVIVAAKVLEAVTKLDEVDDLWVLSVAVTTCKTFPPTPVPNPCDPIFINDIINFSYPAISVNII